MDRRATESRLRGRRGMDPHATESRLMGRRGTALVIASRPPVRLGPDRRATGNRSEDRRGTDPATENPSRGRRAMDLHATESRLLGRRVTHRRAIGNRSGDLRATGRRVTGNLSRDRRAMARRETANPLVVRAVRRETAHRADRDEKDRLARSDPPEGRRAIGGAADDRSHRAVPSPGGAL